MRLRMPEQYWMLCVTGEKLIIKRMRYQPVGCFTETLGSSRSLITSLKTSSDKIFNELLRITSESPFGIMLDVQSGIADGSM